MKQSHGVDCHCQLTVHPLARAPLSVRFSGSPLGPSGVCLQLDNV
eukprot:COSAG03_NODE_751_length_5994_cov_17.493130_2_plen_45_part_00